MNELTWLRKWRGTTSLEPENLAGVTLHASAWSILLTCESIHRHMTKYKTVTQSNIYKQQDSSSVTLLNWTKHLKSTDHAVKSKTKMWEAARPQNAIAASVKSMLGRIVVNHTAYRIANGQTSKRQAQCFFLRKSTFSTTFPPTRKLDISKFTVNRL